MINYAAIAKLLEPVKFVAAWRFFFSNPTVTAGWLETTGTEKLTGTPSDDKLIIVNNPVELVSPTAKRPLLTDAFGSWD